MESKQIVFFATVTAGVMVSVGLAAAAVSNVLEESKTKEAGAPTQIVAPSSPPAVLSDGNDFDLPEIPEVAPAPVSVGVPKAVASATVAEAAEGKVVSAEKVSVDGTELWAVTVKKTDGSKLLGYVDADSGAIVNWSVIAPPTVKIIKAPAPAPSVANPAPTYESDDEYEDDEDDEDEKEGREAHEGDDDDD